MKKKFKIATIGCRTNQYESQAMRDQLKGLGLISTEEDADICIINSCSVTKSADKSTLFSIKQLREKHKNAKFFITGCFGEAINEKLDFDGMIVPNAEKEDLVAKIYPERVVPRFNIKNFENHTRAFVKVQDGCDSYCTYCVIPYTRGRSKSRDFENILTEIHTLSDRGYKEIVLTGINLGEFNSKISLPELIQKVDEIEGIERIRLSSIDPQHITKELIDVLINVEKAMPSLHLVLQSGSNTILKKMNRKYDREIYLEKVNILKSLNKDFSFTTDVIVGFPSETDDDFEKTKEIINLVEFSKVHVFPYSVRPNTAAANFKDHIDVETINKRKSELIELFEKKAYDHRNNFQNREMKVLFESSKEGYFSGHSENNILVNVLNSDLICSNMILDVKIVSNDKNSLIGELCK